jgi:hypothetical protein
MNHYLLPFCTARNLWPAGGLLLGNGTLDQGYKNRPVFLKIIENLWNPTGLNLKTAEITVYCFKISEKDKNQ